ncbi:aminodeoxychorismate synthase, component I [Aequorivita sublithincola DSM 14238]|uniref:aminodeoxychorismate synthase n=1 Tax=Aequorivita sublithincola (strain DSM 14238 / LMG 21431 / ACAM 643 / 9-3) TaxID=746697 RepID=I3YYC4_AEQSU|nr:aminodeoxychorismate synthase component I [Aequorivita sublithincola]AFL81992.1 aminodeoxychorismate synthase, component I [Aequorivita sublithincola DSM 14238]
MRTVKKYPFSLNEAAKNRLLLWAQQFEEVVWLDSNTYLQKHQTFQAILAVDAFTALKTDTQNAFDKLKEYQTTTADWLFGYLSYDLKNDVEKLKSSNFDGLNFPDLYFFQPKRLFLFSEENVEIQYLNMVSDELEADWKTISELIFKPDEAETTETTRINARTSKDSYIQKVNETLEHIKRGDIYEANICQEFYTEASEINPLETFLQLNKISKPPFSVFLKLNEVYALSASPERYIKRTGNSLISQPIKGTAKRLQNEADDLEMAQQLAEDPKERSENIMITDLVRNDLSRIAEKGSVTVEELCGIYTFEQVHQMISTVSCTVPQNTSSVEILRNTFPMGSMTGAPKISAMKIIEDIEDAKRGLYSGAIGYFSPSGDFDFNVVIRSILYNSKKEYISFSVGSAITIDSIPEKEYEECLLKAKAMREVLNSSL